MKLDLTDPTGGSSEPGRYWTRANISEACPAVLTPLCWSLWIRCTQIAMRQTWFDLGLIPRSAVVLDTDPNSLATGCFYGRQAANIDFVKEIVALAPGGSPEEFERDIFGYVRPDAPPIATTRRRYPFVALRMPQVIARQRRRLGPLHDEQLAWWRREVLGGSPTLSPRRLLDDAAHRFDRAMRIHLYSRASLLPAVQTPLTAMATGVGGPELVTRLLGGLGNTVETEIADDLWQLSRGRGTVEDFLRDHGFHGPMEGNPVAVVWRENPEAIRALAAAYARRPETEAPRIREREAQRVHRDAAAELLAGLPAAKRPAARLLLKALRTQTRYLGLGKAAFLMAIDGTRAATRRIGAELVARGATGLADDAFYLTIEELLGEVPENLNELVAFRRERRREYERIELPMTWYGMPTPLETGTPDQGASGDAPAEPDGVITGTAGSSGTAEGYARVIEDPLDGDELEPGEILVCRLTDPSWAALFPLAAAVVIDIGSAASHGAVVSRELGIPCVIGTDRGTRVLRTGDRVRVDGDHGRVEIVRRAGAEPPGPAATP